MCLHFFKITIRCFIDIGYFEHTFSICCVCTNHNQKLTRLTSRPLLTFVDCDSMATFLPSLVFISVCQR